MVFVLLWLSTYRRTLNKSLAARRGGRLPSRVPPGAHREPVRRAEPLSDTSGYPRRKRRVLRALANSCLAPIGATIAEGEDAETAAEGAAQGAPRCTWA